MTEVIDSRSIPVPSNSGVKNVKSTDLVHNGVKRMSKSSVRMTVHPVSQHSKIKKNESKGERKEPRVSQNSRFKTKQAKRHELQVQGAAYNVEEFEKRAHAKAIEDSLRKRERALALKNRRSGRDENKVASSIHRPHVEFHGVQRNSENTHLFKADNITHLSFMVYRLIKTHKITSVIDVPCTGSTIWMPELLKILEFEVPGFHYRCVVPDDDYLVTAILQYKEYSSATVVMDPHVWASKHPTADLAFVWYGLGKSKTKYAIVPNFPNVAHNPGSASKSGHVNVRRAPYRFDEPLRVVNDMSGDPSLRKQLLLYEMEGMRPGVL
ncbi:hypothetical protein FGB62_92g039 [Gracilaria domingensis]|nr:hypothetical protein FGB62_92g039 [Gracilaria domingensis]